MRTGPSNKSFIRESKEFVVVLSHNTMLVVANSLPYMHARNGMVAPSKRPFKALSEGVIVIVIPSIHGLHRHYFAYPHQSTFGLRSYLQLQQSPKIECCYDTDG